MATNTLPVFEYAELTIAPLPMHVMSVESHECIYCHEAPIWDSYEAYVEDFYAYEYEGDRWHAPDERESFEAFAAACTATAD